MNDATAMPLSDAIATLPQWVRLWITWLSGVMFATPIVLLIWRASSLEAIVIIASNIAMVISMNFLYDQVGFVRLLGLPHVIFWTPLAIWLVMRLRQGHLPRIPAVVTGIFVATIVVSLAFDYVDVARYLLGETGPMTEAAAVQNEG